MHGTILSNNSGGAEPNFKTAAPANISSGGFNLVGTATAFVASGDDVLGVDAPLLSPLEDHGGPFPVHLPSASSPAVGVVPKAALNGSSVDARSLPRRADGTLLSDIGAVERQPNDP